MSITHQERFSCSCGAVVEAFVADSLNAGRHPHLKELLLARQLHRFRCTGCNAEFVVDKPLFYFDLSRRQFVCVFPPAERADEHEHLRVTLMTFDKVLGAGAAAAVPVAPTEFMVRMVYGYEELREKIVVDDAGLSDLVVESLKGDLLLADPWFIEQQVLTLRLDRVRDDDALVFEPEWIGGPKIDEVPDVVVERQRYDALAARYDELLTQRPALANGPHCSLLRLIDWRGVDNPWARKQASVVIERKLGPGEA